MHASFYSNDPLASIERHLVRIEQMLEHQSIAIAQLRDELAAATRSNEWYHVQFSEMIRIQARDLRELRATLICSVVSDGPISAEAVQVLLRQTPSDMRELEVSGAPLRHHHEN
jgi:esterase/lipase